MRALCLLVLFAITLINNLCYGIIKKAESNQIIQTDICIPYDNRGSLDIVRILNSKQDTKIKFKINDDKIFEGIVVKVITKEEESITILGEFSKEEKSGFMFFANSKNVVGGVLFFPKDSMSYKLRFDEQNEYFYFVPEKIDIK